MKCLEVLESGDKTRKQSALEELKRIEEAWHHIGSKGVCNYIEKRIKELEKEGVEKSDNKFEIRDFPKLQSPFEREDVKGKHVCVPKLREEYAWIFSKDCLAVDKLDGTNVSVIIEDGRIKNIFNRCNRIDIWKSSKWFYDGVRNSIELGNFNPDMLNDGQYFGELIGPKIQGNPYKLQDPRWVPFNYLKEKYAYKFWEHFVDETKDLSIGEKFEKVSDLFKGLWSIYKRQRGITGEVNETTSFENSLAAEGIVFYNINTGEMCKLRRDMFDWYKGRVHGE